MSLRYWIPSTLNALFLQARHMFHWRLRPYEESADPKDHLWNDYPNRDELLVLEKQLIQEFGLSDFRSSSSWLRYEETLTYLHFLTLLLANDDLNHKTELQWMDAGAKNWIYVQALAAFIEKYTSNYALIGIELDPYRLYRDSYRRIDYAESFVSSLPNARYEVGDVLEHQGQYDVISSFLPFVFEDPCLAWGLPLTFFKPLPYLNHLISLLKPGGTLLILNQGEDEAEAQKNLLNQTSDSLEVHYFGKMPASFIQYRIPRYGWRCQKIP